MFGSRRKRITALCIGVAAVAAVGGGVAEAALSSFAASSLTKMQVRTETTAWVAAPASGVFVDVPGASIVVTVPAGTARMHQVTFTAESMCSGGTVNSWCSVRIVRVSPTGVVQELNPASGTDSAFDSSGGDTWQHSSVAQTGGYVGAGNYTFKVQAAVVNGATTVRLDDWNFAVESLAP